MSLYRSSHIIDSLTVALQYASVYHPPEFQGHLKRVHACEESAIAREAMEQILTSARLAALGRRAICQDTGTVNIRFRVRIAAAFEGDMTLRQMADTAVRRPWVYCDNPLRASIVEDPLFARRNTRDNTPAMVTIEQVSGTGIEIALMVKGGGAENKARFATLKPSDNVADWILEQIP